MVKIKAYTSQQLKEQSTKPRVDNEAVRESLTGKRSTRTYKLWGMHSSTIAGQKFSKVFFRVHRGTLQRSWDVSVSNDALAAKLYTWENPAIQDSNKKCAQIPHNATCSCALP